MPRGGYTIGQGIADAGRNIAGGLSRKWAVEDEKKREQDKNVAWLRASGLDAQYPDIATDIQSGKLDRYSAQSAISQRQAQEKAKADAEEAAKAFFGQAKSDEMQMQTNRTAEINQNADAAQKRNDVTAKTQQDQYRKEAEQAAKTFYAQKKLSGQTTPEDDAEAFGKGYVTAGQAGIGTKPGGGGSTFPTQTQQAARSKDIAYKQIEVDSHKKLPEFQQQYLGTVPVEQRTFVQGGQVAQEAEKLRKRYVDESQLKWLQENPLQSQDEVDAVYESLQDELRSLMDELNDLKR